MLFTAGNGYPFVAPGPHEDGGITATIRSMRIAPDRREDGCVAATTVVYSSLRQLGPRIAPGPPEDGRMTATVCGNRLLRVSPMVLVKTIALLPPYGWSSPLGPGIRIAASLREYDHVAATVYSSLREQGLRRIASDPREDGRIAATACSPPREPGMRIAPGSCEYGGSSATVDSSPRETGMRTYCS